MEKEHTPGPQTSAERAADPADVIARSAAGAATTALAGLFGRAAGLLTTILVTYFLSRADYGHANLALVVATITNLATLLSPQQALLTRRTGYEAAAALAHGWATYSGVVVSGLLALFGPWLLGRLGQPEATPLLWVYCVALLLERIGTIPALELRYRLRFGDVAKLEAGGDLCYVTTTIAAALLGAGALCLPLGMVARHGGRLVALRWAKRGPLWPARPALRAGEARVLLVELGRYSLPIHLGALGELATLHLDNVFVGALYSAAAQGLYAVGYTLVMTPADTIARYGAMAMVRALGLPDAAERQRVFLRGLRYLSLLLFPIGIGAAAVAPTLEAALLPAHWHGVASLMVGLAAGAMSLGCYALSFAQLTALMRPVLGGLLPMTRLAAFALGLFLVTRWDPAHQHLQAVAWAVSAALAVAAGVALWLSARVDRLPASRLLRALAPSVAGSAVMGAGLWSLQRELRALAIAPSLFCLLGEIAFAVLLYGLYLKLCHRAIWQEASRWLRARVRRRPAAPQDI
ncbi:MAG TPA: oligosaccharide flippase family protein [Pseudomonadota bacterium]|nr:oligosaccharide flippase family protein [Pseudomonadota bacterium]